MTRIFFSYRIQFSFGEVAEWFKAHAWKACKPFKGFGGSNPPLSANGSLPFFILKIPRNNQRITSCLL